MVCRYARSQVSLARHLRSLQELATTGSKQWGSWWDGRGLLRVKIYDFAVYANPRHVASFARGGGVAIAPEATGRDLAPVARVPLRALLLLRPRRSGGRRGSSASLAARVRGDARVEMSLLVRPARDLPLLLLRSEYKRILQKRIKALGGDPSDTALATMMGFFSADALPAGSTRRGCFRKDSTLHICRSRGGRLTAAVDGTHLATVESAALCAAVFDLYLGDAPVCRKAQARASARLHQMVTQPLLLEACQGRVQVQRTACSAPACLPAGCSGVALAAAAPSSRAAVSVTP
jgi:hypothetical protein